MFESGPNYAKLKTNLRLAVNRLKLLEKKKTELGLKARKEIADYLTANKAERAKIRVEQIVREDYIVEAMELLEMYCDLLLARFGLVQQMKTLDEGLAEAISSLIWVAPRMQADCTELKIIADQLALKYGKQYAVACRDNSIGTVSSKLMHKLSVQAPPKILVEKYLIEIAKNYNISYEPDPQVMQEEAAAQEALLIDFGGVEGGKMPTAAAGPGWLPPQPGFTPYPVPPGVYVPPPPPQMNYGPEAGAAGGPPPPYNYASMQEKPPASAPFGSVSPNASFNIPPNNLGGSLPSSSDNSPSANISFNANNLQGSDRPKPTPRTKLTPPADDLDFPELPSVPQDNLPGPGPAKNDEDDIDFDDLTRRFEELKKKK
nr:EOG090X0DNH [Eulimnadia texana]